MASSSFQQHKIRAEIKKKMTSFSDSSAEICTPKKEIPVFFSSNAEKKKMKEWEGMSLAVTASKIVWFFYVVLLFTTRVDNFLLLVFVNFNIFFELSNTKDETLYNNYIQRYKINAALITHVLS